jgi:AmpE protein
MILISLLLVLLLERVLVKSAYWQYETYVTKYLNWLLDNHKITTDTKPSILWLFVLVPSLIVALVTQVLVGDFLSFILQSLVLFICLGSVSLRQTYRQFLQAAERNDLVACNLYTEQLGHCNSFEPSDSHEASEQGKSFGQHLLWLNYQHYAAVIIAFIALGAGGVVFYVLSRECFYRWCSEESPLRTPMARLMYALDFIPVRITACGLLLVGDFSKAMPAWLGGLLNREIPADQFLVTVAAKAEYVDCSKGPVDTDDIAREPKILVTLAKRNLVLLLAFSAILTLIGVIN